MSQWKYHALHLHYMKSFDFSWKKKELNLILHSEKNTFLKFLRVENHIYEIGLMQIGKLQ